MRGGPPPDRQGPGGLAPQMLNRLGLSDQQREQVKATTDAHRDDTRALAERQHQARQAVEAAVRSGIFDEGAVREQAMALGQIETDVAVERARVFSEIFLILTPEQQTQLKEMTDRREAERGQMPRGRGAARSLRSGLPAA